VYGIDLSGEQVELAHRRGLDTVERAEAMEYLRDKPGQFAAITAFDLFEHLTRPELFDLLDAIHRALRPGGRLIVQTVNGGSPFHGLIRYGDLTHETAYTPSSLAQAFRVTGFRSMSFHEIVIPVYGLKARFATGCGRWFEPSISPRCRSRAVGRQGRSSPRT
jgi:predicted TPR repeat methyltransferase